MIVLALDALDLNLVKEFRCKNLKQREYGKTDLSDFSQLRTIVLWASFLTGKNMEKAIAEYGASLSQSEKNVLSSLSRSDLATLESLRTKLGKVGSAASVAGGILF